MPDDKEPDWLQEHKRLYGDPNGPKSPIKYTPPTPGSNPLYDAYRSKADQEIVEALLVEVRDQHVYYTRRCMLPKWKPGDGLELA